MTEEIRQTPARAQTAHALTTDHAQALVRIGLAGIGREYPNHIVHLLNSDDDVAPPRKLHPAFHGCFDWHSSVHTHWMLLRMHRQLHSSALRADVEAALAASFAPARLNVEAAYLAAPGRQGFERPYGLAWLLRLDAELTRCDLVQAGLWRGALRPLAELARDHLIGWIPRLSHPVRTGTHNQSAFAFILLLQCAALTDDDELAAVVRAASTRFYMNDRNCPISYEPSGEDFLSPCLVQAHLLSCLLDTHAFGAWLNGFLPDIPREPDKERDWLPCAQVSDESDGRLVHLHGLNLSRAWNLGGMIAGLPYDDARREVLERARRRHLAAGLNAALAASHYASSHWLPTFAVLAGDGVIHPDR